jgi:peptide/nickel transport system substrate-binding protein
MLDRTTKLRWRRRFRLSYRQVEDMGVNAENGLEKYFFKRFARLVAVRRFAFSWLVLVCLLIAGSVTQIRGLSQHYQTLAPAPGGTFSEGMVGTFTNANPLYAVSTADASVSRLIFSGLLKYDQHNQLAGDLAAKLESDERAIRYVVTLKDDLKWQDGYPLTSADVVYTYQTIQNADARSPLFSGWQGVKLEAPDAKTVVFTLPSPLSSFPHSLTNGIVPKHLLGEVEPAQLRTAHFNSSNPVGSGPFKWEVIEVAGANQEEREERIGLVPNPNYYGVIPKLDRFIIRTFRSEEKLLHAYRNNELNAMAGLPNTPDDLTQSAHALEYTAPLTGEVMVFFRNTTEPFNDVKVRQALVQAVDVSAVAQELGYPVIVAKSPLLTADLGYDKTLTQLPTDVANANMLLDAAGWMPGQDGIRSKNGKPLTFMLSAQSASDRAAITQALQKAWRAIGVDTQVSLESDADIQGVVSRHDYDALLYGISMGTDPDVFAYWHSSQIDPRTSAGLNLSEYKSTIVDRSLEAGRTRSDPATRAAKYRPFLEAWRADAPALALYQPRFLYVSQGEIFNFAPESLNTTTDRFANIENWMIRQQKVSR